MGSIVSRAAVKDDTTCCSVTTHVPEDLVKSEILTRLPVISIVRFRCVCKSWKSLLSGQDPDFVQLHLTRNSTNSLISRCMPQHPLLSRFVDLGGSVNGLVCVYYYNFFESLIQSIGLWNPAINYYKDIPLPPCSNSVPYNCVYFGIGFDPIPNDYKVMYITKIFDGGLVARVVAHVYSCNSDSWGIKSVTSTFVAQSLSIKCRTVVHGRPYWCTKDPNCPQRFNVMFFHVQDEVFRLLPALDVCYHYEQSSVLVNFRDSLAFMFTDSVPRTTSRSVDVYVFDEKCHLWTKNYTIGPITIPKSMSLLHCFRNGDLFFSCGKYVKVVAFNPQTHAVNRFASGMYLCDYLSVLFSYGCGYTESLVSVKGMSLLHVPKAATDIIVIEKVF